MDANLLDCVISFKKDVNLRGDRFAAGEKACDRDGDHDDRAEGKYGLVC